MQPVEPANLGQTIVLEGEAPPAAGSYHPYLTVFSGPHSGRRFRLNCGLNTIGRSPKADLVVNDNRVSRIHCTLEWLGERIVIEDKGSTNGTFVDGCRIARAVLSPGVALQIGLSMMRLEFKTEAEIRMEESLVHSATFDGLTGVYNRAHFLQLAVTEAAFAQRHGRPLGIVLADLDRFKAVNDRYGHLWGDFVLTKFAGILSQSKRAEDLLGRYGGDEFILLPRGEMSRENLFAYCERLRGCVAACPVHFDAATVTLSVSLGFHLAPIGESPPEAALAEMIAEADRMLYRAKEKGRNRTEGRPAA